MAQVTPRGIRNQNPLNIMGGGRWQGMVGQDKDGYNIYAETLETPGYIWGFRAAAKLLARYYEQHQLETVNEIIKRWAPEGHTVAGHTNRESPYVRHVTLALDVEPDEEIVVTDPQTMFALLRAMTEVEVGKDAAKRYTDDDVWRGMELAGYPRPRKALSKSRTINASTVSMVSGAGVAAAGFFEGLKDSFSETTKLLMPWVKAVPGDTIFIILGASTVVGALVAIAAKKDDRDKNRPA